jgi:PEGA domain
MTSRRTSRALLVVHLVSASLLVASSPRPAWAADAPSSPMKEAGKHFQRGVSLYNEADYRAALVEFKRAYEIAPNAAVLYNIGQTHYQLQNYASALSTLDRYLTEAGAGAPHRPEVEQTLETLKARVGKVEVTTNLPDCEITIDDELVGKTPLAQPVLVSIGRRKVTAMHDGRPPETRFVEVAAGDTVKMALNLTEPDRGGQPAGPTSVPSTAPPGPSGLSQTLLTAGWITTGVLGAGAITMGILALSASSDLKNAHNTYPTTHDDLSKKASRVSTFSAVADVAGVAAIVVGGVTLYFTLARSGTKEVKVGVAPRGVSLQGTF